MDCDLTCKKYIQKIDLKHRTEMIRYNGNGRRRSQRVKGPLVRIKVRS